MKAQSVQARDAINISAGYVEWTKSAALFGVPKLDRNKDILDIAWAHRVIQKLERTSAPPLRADMARSFFCDLSQSVKRKPWSESIPTLTTTSRIYTYEKDFWMCRGLRLEIGLSEGRHLLYLGRPWSCRCIMLLWSWC